FKTLIVRLSRIHSRRGDLIGAQNKNETRGEPRLSPGGCLNRSVVCSLGGELWARPVGRPPWPENLTTHNKSPEVMLILFVSASSSRSTLADLLSSLPCGLQRAIEAWAPGSPPTG